MNDGKSLAGQVAIVTGAGKGIGAGIARDLAEAGASVVVNYESARADAERVVAEIQGKGGRAVAVQANVSRAEDVERLFAETRAAFGPIDLLVNNAGLYGFGPIESVTVEEFHRLFNVNVLGVMLTIRAAVGAFGERGGSILNIGSNVSSLLGPASVIYAASKCAVDGITGVMARELAGRRIRVNSINPGPTETEGVRALMAKMGPMGEETTGKLLESIPLGRLGQPTDIGPIAVFLASAGAAWITGEIIVASGGMR